MLSKDEKSSVKNSGGYINFYLLLASCLVLFFVFVAIPKKNVSGSRVSSFVLSDKEETETSEEVDLEDVDEDTEEDEDLADEDTEDEQEIEDEDSDDIEELEFEDGEDEDDEDEDEEVKLVEGDTEQKVEIKVENGRIVIKIKTKNRQGREVEEELEATSSATIASLKLQVREGEIKLKLRTEDGKIVLAEEAEEGESLAVTDLPITVDSENNVVTVHTQSGDINITEFPAEVLAALLSSESLDQFDSLELKVKEDDGITKVVYHAKGEDGVKFLGLVNMHVEVEAEVDATTGQTEVVSQPWYLKYLGFLFSEA